MIISEVCHNYIPTERIFYLSIHIWKVESIPLWQAAVAKTDWPESGMSGTHSRACVCTID